MDNAPFQDRMQRIEELIAAIQEHGNPVVRASAVEIVRALLDVHRTGLANILEKIPGAALAELVADELVSRLLLLHGLHPVDLETRVRQALDQVRPLLARHGASVEMIDASHDAVRLRVGGGQDAHDLLERAILDRAPDILRIEIIDADAAVSTLLSLPVVREG
ncbi:MAG: NifU family protein [Planctomycetes bacterium]|nr:NifU family protein [Planctomycetota bacterium]